MGTPLPGQRVLASAFLLPRAAQRKGARALIALRVAWIIDASVGRTGSSLTTPLWLSATSKPNLVPGAGSASGPSMKRSSPTLSGHILSCGCKGMLNAGNSTGGKPGRGGGQPSALCLAIIDGPTSTIVKADPTVTRVRCLSTLLSA